LAFFEQTIVTKKKEKEKTTLCTPSMLQGALMVAGSL
jgi:hypothetical protein